MHWLKGKGIDPSALSAIHAEVNRLCEDWKRLVEESETMRRFRSHLHNLAVEASKRVSRKKATGRGDDAVQEAKEFVPLITVSCDVCETELPPIQVTRATLKDGTYDVEVRFSPATVRVIGVTFTHWDSYEAFRHSPDSLFSSRGDFGPTFWIPMAELYDSLFQLMGLTVGDFSTIIGSRL